MNTPAAVQRSELVPNGSAAALCLPGSSVRSLEASISPRCAVYQNLVAAVSCNSARFRSAHIFRPERQVVGSLERPFLYWSAVRDVCSVPAFGLAPLSSASPSNNSLEPTPATKARFVWCGSGAAQLCR